MEYYREFTFTLSISKEFISKFLQDQNLDKDNIDRFMDMIEDRTLYGILSGQDIEKYFLDNYMPEYVLPAQKWFRSIVLTRLGLSEGDVVISYSIYHDWELISMTHIDCVVNVKFPTEQSLNYFKIKKPRAYQSFIDYETQKKNMIGKC